MSNCFLLLVRSSDDVPRACRDVGEFLAFQRARLPMGHAEQHRRLVGIWLDPLMVDPPPEVFGPVSVSGHRQFRIRESVGVGGIWQLCWLDADHERESADLHTIRETLMCALIKERPSRPHTRTPQFVPVFDANDGHPFILSHTQRLRELFPSLIGEPMTWNRATGELAALAGSGECGRSL